MIIGLNVDGTSAGIERVTTFVIRPQNSPDLGLPLRYMVAGMLGLLSFSAAVPWLAQQLLLTNDSPQVFALTHVAVLGWVTMVMMGALYQLFPVALSGQIRSPKLGRWNFWLYLIGIVGFVPSFYQAWTVGMAVFGALVVGAIAHFVVQLLRSYPSVKVWHPMAYYLLAALGWLVVTICLGFVYVLDWRFGWFVITNPMLAAHAHIGLAGWLSLTLMGVSYRLMALFSLAHGHDHRPALVNLILWNAGLIALVFGLIFWPTSAVATVAASVLALSALVFVLDMFLLFHKRRRKDVTLEQWHTFVSLASLLVAAAMGILLVSGHPLTSTWVVAYGYVVIVGWFGFSIVGKYYKIIPFLTWLHHYSRSAGRGPLPLLKDLVDSRLAWFSFVVLLLGYVGVLGGLLGSDLTLVRVCGLVFFLGALAHVVNILQTLMPWQWRNPRMAVGVKQQTP